MGLKEYKAKRKFDKTPEPKGSVKKKNAKKLKFFIQKHHASHLHYDFRLEMEGVLKSWAIPKGPSMNPNDKRLAVMVEDHPLEYGTFEGIIPKGNYGAGTVMLWDEGEYYFPGEEDSEDNEKKLRAGLKSGNLKLYLKGKKIMGEFALVKIKRDKENEWLLIKKKDKFSTEEKVTEKDRSILTGRSMEEIKSDVSDVWYSPKMKVAEFQIPPNAVKGKMPDLVKPMMATLVDKPFSSEEWLFEVKWDGYRAVANLNYNDVELYSRNLLSFNEAFPVVVNSLMELGIQAILDGEICIVDEKGVPRFELIQNYREAKSGTIFYYVFDLLYFAGYDLTDVPLLERKELLRKIIPEDHGVLRYSDHVIGEGKAFLEVSRKQNLEGIIAKKINSSYQQGVRGRDWLKIKNLCEQEAVIAGFTEPRGGRKKFGALILGVYEEGELIYIGHAGGGFNERSLHDIFLQLEKLIVKKSPFKNPPKTNMPVTWVKPELVCQVKFQEWTKEGIMRQPVFLGLRLDKKAEEVKKEIEKPLNLLKQDEKTKRNIKKKSEAGKQNAEIKSEDKKERGRKNYSIGKGKPSDRPAISGRSVDQALKDSNDLVEEAGKKKKSNWKVINKSREKLRAFSRNVEKLFNEQDYVNEEKTEAGKEVSGKILRFTNLKKHYWPEQEITKGELLEYYHQISPFILPYLIDRPQNLRRNPNGYNSPSFFQKDMPAHIPDWVETRPIYSESNDKDINYLIAHDEASLLYMVNLGCIEINPWLSRINSLDFPDYVVIDLDPQDVPFEQVIDVAQAVKEVLDRAKISGYCKTSGSKGMHIYIPLGAKYDYDQGKVFAEIIAQLTHQVVPEITSLERMPKKRKNKIYLDYLQNRKGQTLAAPYCVRPKPGATVSTPLEWKEVKKGLHPSQFDISTIFERLRKKGDLFIPVLEEGIDLKKALENLGWL